MLESKKVVIGELNTALSELIPLNNEEENNFQIKIKRISGASISSDSSFLDKREVQIGAVPTADFEMGDFHLYRMGGLPSLS
jgi:hypothetical protein